MRSWAGVHLLCSDPRGLVTLMRLLRDPSASFSEDAGLQDVSTGWARQRIGDRCAFQICPSVAHEAAHQLQSKKYLFMLVITLD